MISGAPTAGIFSVAFSDLKHGVVVGGDYTKPHEAALNAAFTADGGATWTKEPGPDCSVSYIRRMLVCVTRRAAVTSLRRPFRRLQSFEHAMRLDRLPDYTSRSLTSAGTVRDQRGTPASLIEGHGSESPGLDGAPGPGVSAVSPT